MKSVWGIVGSTLMVGFLIRWLRRPKAKVFDAIRRMDMSSKMRRENTFAYLNRSARPGSRASRALIETWLSRVPTLEHLDFCSRFRCGDDVQFTSALQELTLHELLLRQGCKLRFHPNIQGTTKKPDFKVLQPGGPEFLLEACTSTEISSGPLRSPRADRIRDFLQDLTFPGYLIGIDELREGSMDLSQRLLANHIGDGIKGAALGYVKESVSIPLLTTADGWRIRLTAFKTTEYGARNGIVIQEAWSRTWNGPSYPLRDSLKKKGGRYGNQLAMPYVIAVNSSDGMLTDRDFEETLFGAQLAHGFWGTATAPNHRRVSAVLFTKNLCEPTLLMGQVYACLYLNPWAHQPYEGVLTKLPTFKLEKGALQEYSGRPLHSLLKLHLSGRQIW